jgi:enterochelin esterase-like enzyme
VEAENGCQYGNGLREVQKQNLHNQFRAICVTPTFSHLPWYADHPLDATIRQESHLMRVVVPFVERNYPAMPHPAGRSLVGFSKSGWGAFSLILRHPDVFGQAAAWDAPLNMQRPDRYGMREIFGTQEHFEKYKITSLLKQRAEMLRNRQRLALVGHADFCEHHQAVHALLNSLGIPHAYQAGPLRKHAWNSGWLPHAFPKGRLPVPEVL